MLLHVLDGTYELFRSYYGGPSSERKGTEVGAVRTLVRSWARWVREERPTHVGIAFDTVIESFRNALFDGYKDGAGIEPELLAQFPMAEAAAQAMGFRVWPMEEFEADDALATAAMKWKNREDVTEIRVCTPDKDLAQVVGGRVCMYNRFKQKRMDAKAVRDKFGVEPASIPDWLALVGDAADGIPGVPRWGAKSAALVLGEYGHIESIPNDPDTWSVKVRGKATLAANLKDMRNEAFLYKKLATLRIDVPEVGLPEDIAYRGPDLDGVRGLAPAFEPAEWEEIVASVQ